MSDAVISTEIHYVWIDEDDEQMSPTHKTLGTALAFGSTWDENHSRIQRALERIRAELKEHPGRGYDRRLEGAQNALVRLTSTGKPPVALRRLVMTTTLERPTPGEDVIARQVIETSRGAASS
jgi:hypothetical protein